MQIKTENDLLADRRTHLRQLASEAINAIFEKHGLTGQVAEGDIEETMRREHLTAEIADCFSAKLREAGIMPDPVDLKSESFKKGE